MTRPSGDARRVAPARLARIAAAVLAGMLGTAALAQAFPAAAADIPGAITEVSVTNEAGTTPLGRFEGIRVTATWAVPDNSAPGDTFSIGLPAELEGLTASFPLQDETGATFSRCEVSAALAVCTLTELVLTQPLDVGGTLFFSGRFTDAVVEGGVNVLDFTTGATVLSVPVEVAPRGPYRGNGFTKFGSLTGDGSVVWYVDLPAAVGGSEGILTDVVITDELDPGLAFVSAESVRLLRGTSLDAAGSFPVFDEVADRSSYSVALSGQTATVTVPVLAAGFYHRVEVLTVPVGDRLPEYTNSATLAATEITGLQEAVTTFSAEAGGDADGSAPSPAPPVVGSGTDAGVETIVVRRELANTGAATATTGLAGAGAALAMLAGVVLLRRRRHTATDPG